MLESLFSLLSAIDNFYWSYIGFSLVILGGIFFSIRSRFFQFRTVFNIVGVLKKINQASKNNSRGLNPFLLYFASVGGMVGLGNVVAIISALSIGGPGALFWFWIASFCGMLIKYSETYLGIKYREPNQNGSFNGGFLYYLKKAYKTKVPVIIAAFLLCVYSIEIFQFTVIVDTFSQAFSLNRFGVILALLGVTFYTVLGGISRLAIISSALMPLFIIIYIAMCLWVIGCHFDQLPSYFALVLKSAFTGHAAVGGFMGSTLLTAAQQGISKAVYSGDIGIGYDSIIQAETKIQEPAQQAKLSIFSLLTDNIICTLSLFVVLVTGIWKETLLPSEYVAKALSLFFPYVSFFMVGLLFLAGFTTITAYLAVGIKCADFLSKKKGKMIFLPIALFSLCFFSFFNQTKALLVMTIAGGLLMLFNLIGLFKLRNEVVFK